MSCHSVMLTATVALVGLFCGAASAPTVTCKSDDPESCMCEGAPIGRHTYSPPPWMESDAASLWDLTAKMDGKDVPLAKYKAKAALIVNVASA